MRSLTEIAELYGVTEETARAVFEEEKTRYRSKQAELDAAASRLKALERKREEQRERAKYSVVTLPVSSVYEIPPSNPPTLTDPGVRRDPEQLADMLAAALSKAVTNKSVPEPYGFNECPGVEMTDARVKTGKMYNFPKFTLRGREVGGHTELRRYLQLAQEYLQSVYGERCADLHEQNTSETRVSFKSFSGDTVLKFILG